MKNSPLLRCGCSDEAREILAFLRTKIKNIPADNALLSFDLHISSDDIVTYRAEVSCDFVPETPDAASERLRLNLTRAAGV